VCVLRQLSICAVPAALVGMSASAATAAGPPFVSIDPGAGFEAVACPSAAQCTAVTQGGKVLTFDPTSVTALGEGEEGEPGGPGEGGSGPLPTLVDEGNQPTAIACASPSQCTVVDDGRDGLTKASTFDPAVPSRASTTVIESGGLSFNATAVACASSTQCVAALQTGVISAGVVVFDPQSTTRPTPVTLGEDAGTGVACPSTTQCTDVIDINEVTFNPTTLSRGGAGAMPARSWTRTQCRSAYASWSGRHRHATRAQSRAEGRALHEKHGCASSGL
jgi:hypothetical protein